MSKDLCYNAVTGCEGNAGTDLGFQQSETLFLRFERGAGGLRAFLRRAVRLGIKAYSLCHAA